MINQQRLTDEFARLAAINSPPLRESAIAATWRNVCSDSAATSASTMRRPLPAEKSAT